MTEQYEQQLLSRVLQLRGALERLQGVLSLASLSVEQIVREALAEDDRLVSRFLAEPNAAAQVRDERPAACCQSRELLQQVWDEVLSREYGLESIYGYAAEYLAERLPSDSGDLFYEAQEAIERMRSRLRQEFEKEQAT